jgi:hypothetical protein
VDTSSESNGLAAGHLSRLLAAISCNPVLFDVGASGEPPPIWRGFSADATYVAFDPDDREFGKACQIGSGKTFILNSAVTNRECEKTKVYLTRSPYCSSTLPPNNEELERYLFSDLFEVESTTYLPATTFAKALAELNIQTIDWLKIDTQGTDLRIYESVPQNVRQGLLAVDIEPGLINAYQGEDFFTDAHRKLISEGFWPSKFQIGEAVRMTKKTFQALEPSQAATLEKSLRRSPAWVEARYLRTIEWLDRHKSSLERYKLLWLFSIADAQFGYALDIADHVTEHVDANQGKLLKDLLFGAISGKEFIRPENSGSITRKAIRQMAGRAALFLKTIAQKVEQ